MLQIPENRPGGERVTPAADQIFHVIPATSAFTKPESYLELLLYQACFIQP